MPIIRRIVRGVASGIGAGREAYEAHKQNKQRQAQQDQAAASSSRDVPSDDHPPEYEEVSHEKAQELIAKGHAVAVEGGDEKKYLSAQADDKDGLSEGEEEEEDDDEIAWELDEAQEAADPPSYDETLSNDVKTPDGDVDVPKLVRGVLQQVRQFNGQKPLPYPVVIPQRRPRNKARGFIRAYPPILENYGIPQEAFMTFLKNFQLASQPSKYLMAVFVAAQIVGTVPSVYAMAASMAVSVAAGTAIELQRRYRANTFLDEMNEVLFKPRGLFALVMGFKPNMERPVDVMSIDTDTNALVTQRETPAAGSASGFGRKMKVAQGKTYGEVELGEVAPLIYPALDAAAANPDSSGFKKASKFLADYADRRAQADYAHKHPGSTLANPQDIKFVSRYSDPNHPASSGSLISLLTGGHINPVSRKDQRRQLRREYQDQRRIMRGRAPRYQSKDPDEPSGVIGKMLRQVCLKRRGALLNDVTDMNLGCAISHDRQYAHAGGNCGCSGQDCGDEGDEGSDGRVLWKPAATAFTLIQKEYFAAITIGTYLVVLELTNSSS